MGKIKAGIIGCGGIANGKHLPSIAATGMVEIIGFCDIVEERAKKACEEFGAEGAKAFTDYKKMLDMGDIEAVYVCTPNRSHCEITVAALHAGKHVMCEKPMAINAVEAAKMVETAEKTGKLLTIAYQNRFRPEYMYTQKIVAEGGLGDIYFARAKAVRRRGVPTWGVFLNKEEQGGGPLIDIGTHALDLTLWAMNNYKPKYVSGSVYHKLNSQKDTGNNWGDWNPKEFTVEDSAFGFVVMEDGATIILETSWALNDRHPDEAIFTLAGTKAGVDFSGETPYINEIRGGRQTVAKVEMSAGGAAFFGGSGDGKPEYLEQITFLNAVQGKGELVVKPEQAYAVTQILDALYESGRTGKAVYF